MSHKLFVITNVSNIVGPPRKAKSVFVDGSIYAGGGCQCGMDKENITYVDCKKDSYDAYSTMPLETAWISVKMPIKAQMVDLSCNAIKALKKDKIVSRQESIVQLNVSNNFIQVIDHGAFDTFERLEVLVLSHNRLRSEDVTENWLTNKLVNLKELYLDNNRIGSPHFYFTSFNEGVFDKLKSLRKLVLDRNYLILTKNTFGAGLANLRTLSLNYCNIFNLNHDIVAHLTGLEELSLIGNPLSYVPAAIGTNGVLPQLTVLDLSESGIRWMIYKKFEPAKKLETLLMKNMPHLLVIS
jgi:hypothetical protein